MASPPNNSKLLVISFDDPRRGPGVPARCVQEALAEANRPPFTN